MSEQPEKKYVKEWSFSFEKLSEQIGEFVKSVGVSAEEAIKQGQFSAPLEGAESARVRLDLSVGETMIAPLTDSENLIEADLTYVGEIHFTAESAPDAPSVRVVSLSQAAGASDWFRSFFGWIGSRKTLKWDIQLSPNVPMDLDIRAGVGESRIDLGALRVTALHLSGGTGEIDVTLPATDGCAATISGGVGETRFTIPDGANIDLTLRVGTGESDIFFGENVNVTAEISGGIGECKLHIPEGAAARIEAKLGIGGARVPARFARLGGSDAGIGSHGVWQTVNYDAAERKINVKFTGGIGELKVK